VTTLAVAAIPGFILVLSDRRLTNARTGIPDIRSNATKSVLFHKSMVIAFTGIAHLATVNGASIPTNEWIAEQVQSSATPNDALRTLKNRLNDHFAHHRLNPRSAHLSVVGAGWSRSPAGPIPVWFKVTNASKDGLFVGSMSTEAPAFGRVRLRSYGIPFDPRALAELTAIERRHRRRERRDPVTHLDALVSVFRRFADRTENRVSRDLLVTSLPEPDGTPNYGMAMGPPNAQMPTFMYLPAGRSTGREAFFAPTAVFPGMLVAEMSATYGP
jgi:hypothetical protein